MKHRNSKIRMQAEDFLKAYEVLNQNYKFTSLAVMGPGVVCLAFAVELYLKDLHDAINGKAPWGHDICKLFEALPDQTRQDVFNHKSISENPFMIKGNIFSTEFFNSRSKPYDRFLDQMKGISGGFEEWRYAHEKQGQQTYDSSFALALITAIASITDGMRVIKKKG